MSAAGKKSCCRKLRKAGLVAGASVLGLVAVWAGIGVTARWYEFRDDDPQRGAMVLEKDLLGDQFSQIRYLQQGWDAADSLWFYNTTQGSDLLPYDFFLLLKQPDSDELFRSAANMNAYRYLPQRATTSNPDGLPVGMARDSYRGKDYFGFTCAACHTSQLNYRGVGIRIDGGPSAADFENFMTGLAAALKATLENDSKRQAFVQAVLGLGNYDSADAIEQDLQLYTRRLEVYNTVNRPASPGHPETRYGYARLDAFGRIYNRVLEHAMSGEQLRELLLEVLQPGARDQAIRAVDAILEGDNRDDIVARIEQILSGEQQRKLRDAIYNPADAPVSYPFLWDIPQHDYVQWNGVVANAGIGSVARNAGQVIGVFGTLDWQEKPGWTIASVLGGQGFGESHVEFTSSIDIRNLRRVESHLRDLQSPRWPEDILPALEQTRLERGRALFSQYCGACHERIDRSSRDRRVIAQMTHVDHLQTDSKMANNSVAFTGYSGIMRNQYGNVGIGKLLLQKQAPVAALLTQATENSVLTADPDKNPVQSMAERLFDLVTTFFDNEIKPSLKQGDYTSDTPPQPFASLMAYKGRSLNGIWATAPYLHNGSVPSLYDLLLPKKRATDPEDGEYRPDTFMVGSREFDPEKVGFRSEGYDGFRFDTSIYGNGNGGHEYAAGRTAMPDGKTRPPLNREQRLDLLEYLKSL